MSERLDHQLTMKLAVQLACSYLGSSSSGSTHAEELILSYYRQLRNVESRLGHEYGAAREEEQQREREAEQAERAAREAA